MKNEMNEEKSDTFQAAAYPEDVDLNQENSKEPFSFNRIWLFFSELDHGGWKFQIASRSLFAGGLAFLFRMFVRLPFDNIMFFCAIMFTMFALMIGGSSIRRIFKASFLLYALTACSFFIIALLSQFPGLQLAFLFVYTFTLMATCRQRLIAVMPIGYSCIAVSLPGGWLAGVNYSLALMVCFLCTVIAVYSFPGAYGAMLNSMLIKYFREIKFFFQTLVTGKQLEGTNLIQRMNGHFVLSYQLKTFCNTDTNDHAAGKMAFNCRRRYLRLRDISRGLSILRGFGSIRSEFLEQFPDGKEFFAQYETALASFEKSLLYNTPYQGPGREEFINWQAYFSRAVPPGSTRDYAFIMCSLCTDMLMLIEDWDKSDDTCSSTPPHFFSLQTRLWEALRFTGAIAVSFLLYRVFRIPYGQWIGMFTAFIYVVPQHGLVFQRINKGLGGTILGVILGFLAIELTMNYCYLWAYLFPLAILFFLYIFLLRNDFAILMLGFAFGLMFSLIVGAPESSWPNLYQALGARMASALIAAFIVFIFEMFTFSLGAVINDIRKSANSVFDNMGLALVDYSRLLFKTNEPHKLKSDDVSDILAKEGAIRLFCEALEFEIGYNPQMNEIYADFLRHLHVSCLYIRKLYYISKHSERLLDTNLQKSLDEAIDHINTVLLHASNFKVPSAADAQRAVTPLFGNNYHHSEPTYRLFIQTLYLFASNVDKLKEYSHYLTKSSILFQGKTSCSNLSGCR